MKTIVVKDFNLDNAGIDLLSEALDETLSGFRKIQPKERLRIRLSAEEMLLNWQEKISSKHISLQIDRRRNTLYLRISLTGTSERFDPTETKENGGIAPAEGIIANLGGGWVYRYADGINTVLCSVSTVKHNRIRETLIAIALALITVPLIKLLPGSVGEVVNGLFAEPLFTLGSRFLTAAVAPMMFLAIVNGVIGMGAPGYLNVYGKRIFARYTVSTLTVLAFSMVVACFFFPVNLSKGGTEDIYSLVDMFTDLLPRDIFSPFIDVNIQQIAVFGLIIGIAMLFLQRQLPVLIRAADEANILLLKLLDFFDTYLLSVFLYVSLVNLGLTTRFSSLLAFFKVIGIFSVVVLTATVGELLYAAAKLKMSPIYLTKRLIGTVVSGTLSCSSAACFEDAYCACEQTFGVEKRLSRFGLSTGTVIHKPMVAVEFLFFVFGAFAIEGKTLDVTQLILLFNSTFLLSVAYPPVSGGELTCYTLLLSQFELPAGYLAAACAVSSLLDYLEVPCNIFVTELQLLTTAEKLNCRKHK